MHCLEDQIQQNESSKMKEFDQPITEDLGDFFEEELEFKGDFEGIIDYDLYSPSKRVKTPKKIRDIVPKMTRKQKRKLDFNSFSSKNELQLQKKKKNNFPSFYNQPISLDQTLYKNTLFPDQSAGLIQVLISNFFKIQNGIRNQ